MLRINGLSFRYGKTPVLNDISFNVSDGIVCGLFGPNGSGKTTLFKCCLKLLKASQGTVFVDDIDIHGLKVEETAKLFAYVPQDHKPQFPFLVKEVVMMGRTPHINSFFGIREKDRTSVIKALELVDIHHLANKNYNELSGGQRQLVLIARAVAQDAKVLFLDEPTSALDFRNQILVWEIMRKIAQTGVTILACSHDPNHVCWFCDRVIVLNDGSVVADGTPSSMITEPVLDEIYGNVCSVKDLDDRLKMVIPRVLFEDEREENNK